MEVVHQQLQKSLKCAILNNRNKFACVPASHSVALKEHYHNIKMVLEKLCYGEHELGDMCGF